MSAKQRTYASDATKRKLQARRVEEAVKTRKIMEHFLLKDPRSHDPEQPDDGQSTGPGLARPLVKQEALDDGGAAIDADALSLIENEKKADEYDVVANASDQELSSSTVQEEEEGSGSELQQQQEINEDKNKDSAVIRNRDFGYLPQQGICEELKAKIVQKGSAFFQNRDSNFFPKVKIYGKQRGLTANVFGVVLPSGEVCNRSWLLFSPRLETLFCFPCVLFTEAPDNMRSTLSDIGIGFDQFRKTDRLKEHEEGIFHRKAVLKWKMEDLVLYF